MELTIPFHIRGNDGTVHVEYLINEDPRRWGNTLVASAAAAAALDAEEIGRGFPLCRASVTYAGEGYAAVNYPVAKARGLQLTPTVLPTGPRLAC